jgi:large subunit ribosomal protein L32
VAVPKKRRSYTKRHMRRSHHALKKTNFVMCANCGEPTLPHRVCPNCNTYKGKRIFAAED